MESAKNLNDVQFFCACAAFRNITVDDIARLLDDSAIRDLLWLVRKYGGVMRSGGAIVDYTEIDGVPSIEARRRAAHLARSLGIDPADTNILPPGVVCAGLSDIHVAALSLRTSECIK
jgi:hypothetical protein